MADILPFQAPKPPPPTWEELAKKARDLYEGDSANMRWDHEHFKERARQRNISMRQVIEVIKTGEKKGTVRKDPHGDWRITLQRKVAGRKVQVVIAVKGNHFDLVTVI